MTKKILFKYTIFAIVGKVRVYIFNMAGQQDTGAKGGAGRLGASLRTQRPSASLRMLPSRNRG